MHIRQYATMYPPICDLLAGFIHENSVPGLTSSQKVRDAKCEHFFSLPVRDIAVADFSHEKVSFYDSSMLRKIPFLVLVVVTGGVVIKVV